MSQTMSQTTIFSPFFATSLLTMVVWIYMYIQRIGFITRQKLDPQDLAAPGMMVKLLPSSATNASDNLKNLFEVPIVFYALCLYLFVTQQVDPVYVNAGWIFVIFRVCHSLIHCTVNRITLRFSCYLLSTIALWFIAIRAALLHFTF